MQRLFLLFFGLAFFGLAQSQVGINTTTPHASSALEIQSTDKGVLLPRMTTAQKNSIVNPAEGLLVYDTNTKCISQNVGTNANPKWVCLSNKNVQSSSFYMPSIAIDASATATNLTLDLYEEYKKQYLTPTVASTGAPASIPYFPIATDLYYYITEYDDTVVKINSFSNAGVLDYDIIDTAIFASFMNVVFVIK